MNSPESPDPKSPAENAEADQVEIEDRMLELMLAEIFSAQSPPDQRRIILGRLDEPASRSLGKKTARSKKNSSPLWTSLIAAAAVVLLVVGVAAGIRYRNVAGVANNPVPATPGRALADSQAGEQAKGAPVAAAPARPDEHRDARRDASSDLPSRRIEVANSDSDPSVPNPNPIGMLPKNDRSKSVDVTNPQPIVQKLTLVSASMTDHLRRYWHRLGLQPTDMLAPDEIAARLRTRFGIDVPESATVNVESIRQALAQPPNTQSIAVQVLAAISSRPAESLTRPSDQRMITEISDTLRRGSGFDRLYVSWFATPKGNSPKGDTNKLASEPSKTGAALAPIGELLRPLDQHEAFVTTAAVALNADMRCQRCHDLKQGPMGRLAEVSQHDYWQFAATISPALPIRSNAKSGWFYDTSDGRRRLAEADSNRNWPDRLAGSRALAKGLVGAIWANVHGRPLVSSPYDLTGGAEDSELERLRDDLADDLVAHDFDLLRTISLMLTDSILGRRAPAAMTPAGVLVASDEEWQRAVAAVESFAASPPDSMPSTRGQRLRLVQNSDLPTLKTSKASVSVLAQPISSEETGSQANAGQSSQDAASASSAVIKPSPAVLAGLPMRPIVVMPAWIVELPDFDSRLQHIAHLAGLVKIPDSAKELATKMRDADVEEALILQRIWWIIRPQG